MRRASDAHAVSGWIFEMPRNASGISEVGWTKMEGFIGHDVAVPRLHQIAIDKQVDHVLDVARKQNVVVTEVHDRVASRFSNAKIAMKLAAILPLRQVEEANAGVARHKLLGNQPRGLIDTVAEDDHLKISYRLPKCTTDGHAERSVGVKRRNEDARANLVHDRSPSTRVATIRNSSDVA